MSITQLYAELLRALDEHNQRRAAELSTQIARLKTQEQASASLYTQLWPGAQVRG